MQLRQLPPVNRAFMDDFSSPVAVLGGPIGTGKTFVLGLKCLGMMTSIVPVDGVRKSRFAFIRKNYGELEKSIVKDMEDEILPPGSFKTVKGFPITTSINFKLTDGTTVESEIHYFGMENDAAIKKLKSLKYTAGFVVEAQQLESDVSIQGLFERARRYPFDLNLMIGGKKISFGRIYCDFNFPEKTHWFYDYMVTNNKAVDGKKPRTMYRQPPAFIFEEHEDGEYDFRGMTGHFHDNPDFLPYSLNQKEGMKYWRDMLNEWQGDDGKIQADLLSEFSDYSPGKAVYPKFRHEIHVSDDILEFDDSLHTYIGVDNGLNNAFIFCQVGRDGVLYVIDEIVNVDENSKPMMEAVENDVIPFCRPRFTRHRPILLPDPAVRAREGNLGTNQKDTLRQVGKIAIPNYFTLGPRLNSVNWFLDGHRMVVSKNCKWVVDGLAGGYHYDRNRVTGVYKEEPAKDEYSHPINALEQVTVYLRHGIAERKPKKKKVKKRYRYS